MSSKDNTSCNHGPCNTCPPAETPLSIDNVPNRSSLEYRVGTHGSFKATMLRQLTQGDALRTLTANSDQDLTVALIDASSVTLDILSFYQQRLANEHYLGTATERYSINKLAQSIGYKLSPGVAATGYLAFSLLDAPGSPTVVTIPEHAQAQSQPKGEQSPQIFETSEAIEARTAWNAMTPQLTRWQVPTNTTRTLHLNGLIANLSPGDPVLLVSHHADTDDTQTLFRRIQSIDTDFERELTKVRLDKALSNNFLGGNAEERSYEFFALRQQAAIFGYNEVKYDEKTDANDNVYLVPRPKDSSERATLSSPVQLDNAYKNISPDSWVVFKKSSGKIAVQVDEIKEAIADNSMTSVRVTELHVTVDDFTGYKDGNTTIYMQSEALKIVPAPLDTPIDGESFIIETNEYDFRETHAIALAGIDSNTGEAAAEIAFIENILVGDTLMPDGSSNTIVTVTLDDTLLNSYQRDSLSINGNIAHATHGQSRFEILGSGDGSQSLQSFILKNTLLTHVPAANDTGAASTLTVKVDDIEWQQTDTHYGAAADDSSYVVEVTDEHSARINFGDGQRGRRLPTGSNNIVANYRQGLGLDGLLDADQLSILLTRPLGLQSVTNPAATFGGEDPEATEDARINAPLKVLTIDRVVSLNDFTYFARAFTGVAKATSIWIWDGQQRIIHLTVAGTAGATPASDQLELLTEALDKRRDPFQRFEIDGYTPIYFKLQGKLWVDDRYDETLVKETAIAELQNVYAFENRDFGQSVTAAEIYAQLQSIDGVIGVDLSALNYEDAEDRTITATDPAQVRLEARTARFSNNEYLPAEILLIDTEDSTAISLETQTTSI